MEEYFSYVLPAHALYVRVAQRLLEKTQTRSIVNSRIIKDTESAVSAVAQARGIRITTILHGLIGNDPDVYFGSGRFDLQDGVFVWNAAQAQHVRLKAGKNQPKIFQDGNPQWESIGGLNIERGDFLGSIGIPSTYERVITFCAQPSNTSQIWCDIADAAKNSSASVIIKTHPTIPKNRIVEAIGSVSKNLFVVDDSVPLYPLLKISDLMITVSSTTLFESIIIGTPVVLYAPKASDFIDELSSFGIPVASDKKSLEELFSSSRSKTEYLEANVAFKKRYIGERVDYQGISRRILSFAYGDPSQH
jgi:hypothetical protein